MTTNSVASAVHVTMDGRSSTTRADAAVADYARGLHAEALVVAADRDRDEADVTGHRATELTTKRAVA